MTAPCRGLTGAAALLALLAPLLSACIIPVDLGGSDDAGFDDTDGGCANVSCSCPATCTRTAICLPGGVMSCSCRC